MSVVYRVKGIKRYKDRTGTQRYYHRATGTALKSEYGSAAFISEVEALDAKVAPKLTPKSGTLGGLIAAYRAWPRFETRATRTQSDYQKIFDYLKPLEDTPLSRFDSALVLSIQEKAWKTRNVRFANYVVAVISIIFNFGKPRKLTTLNPAEDVPKIERPRDAPDANRPWTPEECAAVLEASDPYFKPALAIMMFTGLGPKDTRILPRTFYRDGKIATTRSKTGNPVYNKAITQLRKILDDAPKHNAITLCAHSGGKPWTESGMNKPWQKIRARLELEGKIESGLTLYGLRHTYALTLRELGYDDRTIADALGQDTPAMALHYAKHADLTRKMDGVSKKLNSEMNRRRTKVSNRNKKSV